MLTNMHKPPQEGNLYDEQGNTIKLDIVAVYNHHMGCIDKRDRMAKRYSVSHWTWKWTKNLSFFVLDLVILNSYMLVSSCGGKKISHTFSSSLSEEHAGNGWKRTVAGET
jgi:hypothetical protein